VATFSRPAGGHRPELCPASTLDKKRRGCGNHVRKPYFRGIFLGQLARRWRALRASHGRWRSLSSSVALECRSLLFRIWKLEETSAYFFGYQGPVWIESSAGLLVRCEATPARIRDTRDMLANHPAATTLDVDLFLEGWTKGAQWAANSIYSHEYHTAQRVSQASANVIEQLEALQASRCDLLSRIPSRV
jgi:hypothetical protein